jgi:hypothetical protein
MPRREQAAHRLYVSLFATSASCKKNKSNREVIFDPLLTWERARNKLSSTLQGCPVVFLYLLYYSVILFTLVQARWQSGYAADCNSVYAGSIPTRASSSEDRRQINSIDALDSKSIGITTTSSTLPTISARLRYSATNPP